MAEDVVPVASGEADEVTTAEEGEVIQVPDSPEPAPPINETVGQPEPVLEEPPETSSKKRKADEDEKNEPEAKSLKVDEGEDDDDGAFCPICFEPWTNSGEHRISSLKCGHFFGRSCIEKWLRSSGDDCPNCNEKATKKDVRLHYVARLKAVDTADKDRAVKDLDKVKTELRSLELEHNTLKVTSAMQREEIDKLRRQLRQICPDPGRLALLDDGSSVSGCSSSVPGSNSNFSRLHYVKRLDLIKADQEHRERYCRVMAYNDTHGMLAVSQPSFTALAPGYGVRRLNMLDLRVEKFVCLHREPIRDLAFNPVCQDQLLSVSQDKSARLTNISSCAEIQRYILDAEAWSCCWNSDQPTQFFVGTKRSGILLFDTRSPSGSGPKQTLEFPVMERRPVIGLSYLPSSPHHKTFPCGGLVVQTLGSLWFFESCSETVNETGFKAHKLKVDGLFWSLRVNPTTRLIMVSTKPTPHARHVVIEPIRINVSEDVSRPDFQISANVILDNSRGGSYTDRSFLRPSIFSKPGSQGQQMMIAYGRGSASYDHKLVLQEVGSDKVVQEIPVPKPILDVCTVDLNGSHYVTMLSETEVFVYKWT